MDLEFFHINSVLEKEVKIFTPRIPDFRAEYEDNKIPRICVSDNLLGCMNAHPTLLQDILYYIQGMVVLTETQEKGFLYRVHHLRPTHHTVISPEELIQNELVPDAEETREHWITNRIATSHISYVFIKDIELVEDKETGAYSHTEYIYTVFEEMPHFQTDKEIAIN